MLSHNLEMSEYKENNEERRERNGERRNVKIIRESNGFIKESFEEDLENGNIRITSLLKDPNGNIISRQSLTKHLLYFAFIINFNFKSTKIAP